MTLIDAWGARKFPLFFGRRDPLIRGTLWPEQPYTAMAARALKLWRNHERHGSARFVHRIGVLWMAADNDDAWEGGSLEELKKAKIPYRATLRAGAQETLAANQL